MSAAKNDIVERLQRDVLSLQGYKKVSGSDKPDMCLGAIENAFPQGIFPINAVHEFISNTAEENAATNGFISGLMSRVMQQDRTCLWISNKRTVFPPALKLFGLAPERIIFLDLTRQKDVLWAVEEALKCEALSAVIGELKDLSFTESRRLQLAVEQSGVTGLIHRYSPRSANTVACLTRWSIKPMITMPEDGMPGVGLPRWNVQLLKVRNGKPGRWMIEWTDNGFRHITLRMFSISQKHTVQTG
ncbi:MAG: Error-prone repair protein ImuA [Sphingobacteriales bacterium]|nr:MAG: Error-prone repair protein ImuA [Sphingobacteriales bacterium]